MFSLLTLPASFGVCGTRRCIHFGSTYQRMLYQGHPRRASWAVWVSDAVWSHPTSTIRILTKPCRIRYSRITRRCDGTAVTGRDAKCASWINKGAGTRFCVLDRRYFVKEEDVRFVVYVLPVTNKRIHHQRLSEVLDTSVPVGQRIRARTRGGHDARETR